MDPIVFVILLVLALFIVGSAAYASLRAAPWLPLRSKDYPRILKLLQDRTGSFVDFGAGDGRLLSIVAKQTPLTCVGYEISFVPYLAARIRMLFVKSPRIKMHFKDFFLADVSAADTIFCFLTPPAMPKVKALLERTKRPGQRIICYSFLIPGWTPTLLNRDGTGIPMYVYDR